jgi:hypothetical protein
MVTQALRSVLTPWLVGVAAVLIAATAAAGGTFYDMRPLAAADASAGAVPGTYQFPPGIGAVSVTVSGFGYVPTDLAGGQYAYFRLLVSNRGDQVFTLDPAASTYRDDLGNQVSGAALFSGDQRLTTLAVGPGGSADVQLGFAVPAETPLASIGTVAMDWAYAYAGARYSVETQMSNLSSRLFAAPPVRVATPAATTYVVGQAPAYDYGLPTTAYYDAYPTAYLDGYPSWFLNSNSLFPWWGNGLVCNFNWDRFRHFRDGDFDRDDFSRRDRGFIREGTGIVGDHLNRSLVQTDRLAGRANVVGSARPRETIILPGITNRSNIEARLSRTEIRTFSSPRVNEITPQTSVITPRTTNILPRTTNITPRETFIMPRTTNITPRATVEPRTFSTPRASTFVSRETVAPRTTFASGATFSSRPAGGASFHAASPGASVGGGSHGGGRR